MRSLVIGARGFLGHAVEAELGRHAPVTATTFDGRDGTIALDICDGAAVAAAVGRADVVVFAAALADVDACELRPDRSRAVNVAAAMTVATACANTGALLVLLSSDYVFDGRDGPYAEHDAPAPLNVYGRHKLAAERLCATACERTLIVRLAHVWGPRVDRRGLLDALLEADSEQAPLYFDNERLTTPIFLDDAAAAIALLSRTDTTGLVHLAGPQVLTRLGLAEALAEALGVDAPLRPLDAPPLARRPRRCGLRSVRLPALGIRPRACEQAALDVRAAMRVRA